MSDEDMKNALMELRYKLPEEIWNVIEEYCGDWSTLQWIQTVCWILDNYEPTYQGLMDYDQLT